MSLFVARMITPLIAAYFLRSHGVQPHADWKWMDVYLKVLNWSLDTSKAHALLAQAARSRARSSAITRSAPCSLLLVIAIRARNGHGGDEAGSACSALPVRSSSCSRFLVGAADRLRRGQANRLPRAAGRRRRQYADWHGIMPLGWKRAWTITIGDGRRRHRNLAAERRSCSASSAYPSSRRRTATSRASTSPCRREPRSKQTEAVVDRVAAIIRRIRTSKACSSASMSAKATSTSCSRRTAS